jgi:hypothetical protein
MRHSYLVAFALVVGCSGPDNGGSSSPIAHPPGVDDYRPGKIADGVDWVEKPVAVSVDGYCLQQMPLTGAPGRWRFDSAGAAHLIYFVDDNVRYALAGAVHQPGDVQTVMRGRSAELAFGPDGRPQIFSHNENSLLLGRARSAPAGWLLDAPFGVDASDHFRVAIDARGFAHVAVSGPNILYAENDTAGAWSYEPVVVANRTVVWDLELDGGGHDHIFYTAGDNSTATNVSGSWQAEAMFDHAWGGPAVLDRDGNPHVVYPDRGAIHHVAKLADGWHDETLPVSMTQVYDAVIDRDGALHLLGATSSAPLVHATNAGGTWTATTIWKTYDPFRPTGGGLQAWLHVDDAGGAHVALQWRLSADPSSGRFAVIDPC